MNKYHRSHVSCALCDNDFKDSFEDYLNHLESGHFIKLTEYDCALSGYDSNASQDEKTHSERKESIEVNVSAYLGLK